MPNEENKAVTSKIKNIYDKYMKQLKGLFIKEINTMKEYRETDRQEKINEIKDQLGI